MIISFKLLVLSLFSTVSRCHGRRTFHRIRRFWQIRGGASDYEGQGNLPDLLPNHEDYAAGSQQINPQQGQYQNQQQQRNPDGTHRTDSSYSPQYDDPNHQYNNHQHDPYHIQQQQQQQSPPHLPPGVYGEDNGQPPLPPDYRHQQQQTYPYPSLPDESSLFVEDDEPDMMNADPVFEESSLADFDKQYILKGLARLYRKKILPLEISSRYGHFYSPPLSPADFVAPPQVLLLGQYSVGKTSFIKYLVGRDFPGIRVGPEPTTDRFTAVLWGPNDKIVPGAALCSQTDRPFTGLNPYGNNFLSRMEGVEANSPILQNVTLIDTPGILSGQKQKSRNYDYKSVMKWFGERADLVIIMFDAHKLDISDELKGVMELFIPHLDKIRIVLNKADSISTQQLMRVYGALMWSLGKVMNTPEVCRVYLGSFWDAPLKNTEQMDLLQQEETDLLNDIMNLPQQAVMRRINELVKRTRSVKVHAYIIHYLRKQLPYTWGKREKQHRLIGRLESEFAACARRYGLPKGDFPPVEPFRKALLEIKDLSEFPKLDKKFIREMEKVFSVDIPDLLDKARSQK